MIKRIKTTKIEDVNIQLDYNDVEHIILSQFTKDYPGFQCLGISFEVNEFKGITRVNFTLRKEEVTK